MNSLLLPWAALKAPDTKTATGKLYTQRIRAKDRSTIVLAYTTADAVAMRALAQSIQLKGNRKPSLSLLSRRAMALYVQMLDKARAGHPMAWTAELAALEKLATVTPTKKPA